MIDRSELLLGIVEMLAWLDIAVVGSVLLFAGAWHLYYNWRGKPESYDGSYEGFVAHRGLMTVAIPFGAALIVGISGIIGANVTARMQGAEVSVINGSIFHGEYKVVLAKTIPEKDRGNLDEDDLILVRIGVSKDGYTPILRSFDGALNKQLRQHASVKVLGFKTTKRHPAKIFQAFGAVYDDEQVLAIGSDRLITSDLHWWTSVAGHRY